MKYDFGGYATKANIRCSDGRTILSNAFSHMDGKKVPLVWQHQRNDPTNVLGHAMLENRSDGVYCYCKFNDTPKGKHVKALVEHGDVESLSIFANELQQQGRQVSHGMIREVSVVIAGANPGALIDNLAVQHSDDTVEVLEDQAVITMDVPIEHGMEYDAEEEETVEHADDPTAQEVFNSMNENQKNLVYALVGHALTAEAEAEDSAEHSDEGSNNDSNKEGDDGMKFNAFEGQGAAVVQGPILTHADMDIIISNAKKCGSLKTAVVDHLEHMADEGRLKDTNGHTLEHGIENLEILFPEAKAITPTPDMIMRQQEWVSKVWNATRKQPFSRIKSVVADITKDEARARGYIKGKKKIEEQFGVLKRVTTPQTVYKLQKMDRDDIIDITDFDVVAWLKAEMRLMLNEELARAVLIGDGRMSGDESKINESNIRPILTDDPMYTIHHKMTLPEDENERGRALIKGALRARKGYRGSGSPTFYSDVDTITDMLLVEDNNGRRIYNTINELASALRVREIVEVPVMENVVREGSTTIDDTDAGKKFDCLGLIVNLTDYSIGADRGGAVTLFDDFDIDFNKYSYLIETRCSGALTRPYSAISLEVEHQGE